MGRDLKVEGYAKIRHHLEVNGHLNFGQKVVTQLTSNTTPVTINSASGAITMHTVLPYMSEETTAFIVHNNKVHAESVILVSFMCALPHPTSVCVSTITEGSFAVTINCGPGTESVVPVIAFIVC